MIQVYCAGKIARNDWRHKIFPELGDVSVYQKGSNQFSLEGKLPRNGSYLYAGPYFCALGHGGAHGKDRHGLGNVIEELDHGAWAGREEVAQLCCQWIDEADVLFVWLTDLTAYGTLVEIGYAVAKRKPVFLFYRDSELFDPSDIWLTGALVERVAYARDVESAFEQFRTQCTHRFYVKRLREMPYQQYLQSAHWKQIRLQALDEAGHRCQLCNSPQQLNVHHRTYERRGEELLGDLTVLCRSCHSRFHQKVA